MSEILPLNNPMILARVSNSPGTYKLLFIRNGDYYISYVGRSDDNLTERLQDHIPTNESNNCIRSKNTSHFIFYEHYSSFAAYKHECELYHETEGRTCNSIHPQKSNLNWICPICGN